MKKKETKHEESADNALGIDAPSIWIEQDLSVLLSFNSIGVSCKYRRNLLLHARGRIQRNKDLELNRSGSTSMQYCLSLRREDSYDAKIGSAESGRRHTSHLAMPANFSSSSSYLSV